MELRGAITEDSETGTAQTFGSGITSDGPGRTQKDKATEEWDIRG